MSKKGATLNKFLLLADIHFFINGQDVYDKPNQRKIKCIIIGLHIAYIISLINLNFVLVTESIFVLRAIVNGSNFIEATMNLSFIGFVFVGDLKIWLISRVRRQITEVVKELYEMHPKTEEEQRIYGVKNYLKRYLRISIFFVTTHQFLAWTYNLYWVVYFLVFHTILQQVPYERQLPYYCWVPFDYRKNGYYQLMHFSQNLAGHTCMSGQIACDLLMCAFVILLVMHYKYLAQRIENHEAGALTSTDDDMSFLSFAISYHQRILRLCDLVNEIFGVSLLCNYLTSAFIICFLGFQLTVGAKIDNALMQMLFLFCSVVQILMISNYAQQLVDSSEYIGDAVFKHNWLNSELRYRKMMVLIIQRAQKPSRLQATSFLMISLVTMTSMLQLSYKFFALLRTMYVK